MTLGLGFAMLLAGVSAYVLVEAKLRQRAFNRKFPPITEVEFLAACSPGTDPAIALRVRRIVSDQLGVEYARLHPAMRLVEDLGAD